MVLVSMDTCGYFDPVLSDIIKRTDHCMEVENRQADLKSLMASLQSLVDHNFLPGVRLSSRTLGCNSMK
jgi:hypothetical protein